MPPVETLYHGIDRPRSSDGPHQNGVREELGIAADAPVVGTVANFKSHKRLDQLLLARPDRRSRASRTSASSWWGRVRSSRSSGSSPLGSISTTRVVFTGFREDAPRVCSTFDVFALSSEHEGLSIALIEALALGKPAVVTDVGGLSEVVEDGRQGYLVPTGQPLILGDRIVRLLKDPALRSRMGAEGRARAEVFDIRSVRPGWSRSTRSSCREQGGRRGRRSVRTATRTSRRCSVCCDALGGGPAGTGPAEFFRWKHLENPFGRSFMLVAEADGRIVGLRAFMRWEFVAGDRRFRAVRAVDTATHPDHQGKGIFSRLTLEALDALRDQADFVFNTPNEKSLPGYLKMGWQVVGRVPIRIRVRRPIRFATRARSRCVATRGDEPIRARRRRPRAA